MTGTESNAIPAENQIKPIDDCSDFETIDDDEFISKVTEVLERNLEAYRELAK